jgi:hypothetical protein
MNIPRYEIALGICAAILCGVIALAPLVAGARGKGGGAKNPPAGERGPVATGSTADLNAASLRVTAIDTLYQFDFSDAQIKDIVAAAAGAADMEPRQAATANPKLGRALHDLEEAILSGKDDAAITKLRLAVVDEANADGVHLSDDVKLTENARRGTAVVFKALRASQIAAYLAGHAYEVGDPGEIFSGALDDLRDARSDAASALDPQAAEHANSLIDETAQDIGCLVAGLDDAKAKSVADQVSVQLKLGYAMKDPEFSAQRARLEDAVAKITSDAPAMQVLGNWIERQIAMLLSNPQLPEAIHEVTEARAVARAAHPSSP